MKRLRDRLALVFGGLMFCLLVTIIVNEESVLSRLVEDLETQRFSSAAANFRDRLEAVLDLHAARLEELDRTEHLEDRVLSAGGHAASEALDLARRIGAERVVLADPDGRILAADPQDRVTEELLEELPALGQTRKALVLLPEGVHLVSTRAFVRDGKPSMFLLLADHVGVEQLRRAAGGEDDLLFLTSAGRVLETCLPPGSDLPDAESLQKSFEPHLRNAPARQGIWRLELAGIPLVLTSRPLLAPTASGPGVDLWFGRLAEEVYAPVEGQRQRVAALGLAGIFGVLAAAFALSGRITRPLEHLNRSMRRVTQGELDPIEVSGRDEVAQLATSFNALTSWLRQRQLLRRYVPVEARQRIDADSEGRVVLGGQRTRVTVLYSDLRGFTALSEQLDASEVVDLLNEYLNAMIAVLHSNGGDISDYLGDAILAVFHDGEESSGLRAVRTALQMLSALEALRLESRNPQVRKLRMGIGIHTGDAVEGNIGSEERLKHAVVGDTVNIGARVQDRSRDGRHTCILITETTRQEVGEEIPLAFFGNEVLKGKSAPVPIWEVVADPAPPRNQSESSPGAGGGAPSEAT